MKRFPLLILLVCVFGFPLLGQSTFGHIRKDRLFKIDPMSGAFSELRVVIEHRFINEVWWFASPHGYHLNWIPKSNSREGTPLNPQKYAGIGMRGGARYYFSGKSPMGLYGQAHAGYRWVWMQQMDEGLSVTSRNRYHLGGIGAAIGWQNLYGAKDNLAYGIVGGLEYLRGFGGGFDSLDVVQRWYEFPFSWKPDILDGFRLYLGIELGFAFKQKRLHW